jgi:hypothetical protein
VLPTHCHRAIQDQAAEALALQHPLRWVPSLPEAPLLAPSCNCSASEVKNFSFMTVIRRKKKATMACATKTPSRVRGSMASLEFDKAFQINRQGIRIHLTDSFECAIHSLAPECELRLQSYWVWRRERWASLLLRALRE